MNDQDLIYNLRKFSALDSGLMAQTLVESADRIEALAAQHTIDQRRADLWRKLCELDDALTLAESRVEAMTSLLPPLLLLLSSSLPPFLLLLSSSALLHPLHLPPD